MSAHRWHADWTDGSVFLVEQDGYDGTPGLSDDVEAGVRGGPVLAAVLDHRRGINRAESTELLCEINEWLGHAQISPSEVLVTNFRDSETGIPALTDERFYAELKSSYGNEAKLRETHSTGEYGPVHDWGAEASGSSLLSPRPGLTSDILQRIHGWRALSDSIQEKWASRAREVEESRNRPPSNSVGLIPALRDAAVDVRFMPEGRSPGRQVNPPTVGAIINTRKAPVRWVACSLTF